MLIYHDNAVSFKETVKIATRDGIDRIAARSGPQPYVFIGRRSSIPVKRSRARD